MVVLVQLEHSLRAEQTVQLKVAVGQGFRFVPVNVERFVPVNVERFVYALFVQQIEIYAHVKSLFH